ncbi:MAG: hypothetical protein ABJC10_04735 [Acidobacteriota bacterium]
MSSLTLLFDVPADPVNPLPWGALIVLLGIVFVLAVGLVAGLVVFLIWFKRRQLKGAHGSSQ